MEREVLARADAPCCPSCTRPWSADIIDALLSKAFRRGALRAARTRTLLNNERALLPETQAAAFATRVRSELDAATADVAAVRAALAFPAMQRLRVRAAPCVVLANHLKEHDAAAALLTELAALGAPRQAALEAATTLRAAAATRGVTEDEVRVARVAFDAATTAAAAAIAALDTARVVETCAAAHLDTVRQQVRYTLEAERDVCTEVARALAHAPADTLARLAAAHAVFVRHRTPPPVDGGGAALPRTAVPVARVDADIPAELRHADTVEPPPAVRYVCKCPADGCRGSIPSNTWQCTLCSGLVCATCHEPVRDAAHTCDASIVASVRAIADDIARGESRQCPACLAPVSRKQGCNTMWCTLCHTWFDFATGRRLMASSHNPEHSDWVRRQRVAVQGGGANAALRDVAAAGGAGGGGAAGGAGGGAAVVVEDCTDNDELWNEASLARLVQTLEAVQRLAPSAALEAARMRAIVAFRACMEVHGALQEVEYTPATYRDLRIKYLLGELDDAAWEAAVAAREGRRECAAHVTAAERVLLAVASDALRAILELRPHTRPDLAPAAAVATVTAAVTALEETRKYVNRALADVHENYGGTAVAVDDAWTVLEGRAALRFLGGGGARA